MMGKKSSNVSVSGKKDSATLVRIVEKAIREKYPTRNEYLEHALGEGLIENVTSAKFWFTIPERFNLHRLKRISDDLGIEEEVWMKEYGRNPFAPPLDEYKKSEFSDNKLVAWYIEYRTGESRDRFIRSIEGKLASYTRAAKSWVSGRAPFPLFFLRIFADALDIPREDLIGIHGRDPFTFPLEDIRKEKFPLGKLIDWYIEFRTGKSRLAYLRSNEETRGRPGTIEKWINGSSPFPLYYLKVISDGLNIPKEELSIIIGRDPFSSPLDDILKSENPTGNLIEWYIDFRRGMGIIPYLEEHKGKLVSSVYTVYKWISEGNLPLYHLKLIVEDLQIPIGEIIRISGKNPFVPPLEKFKNSANPMGDLIEWYIGFRTGKKKKTYLKEQKTKIGNVETLERYLKGSHPFPLETLKRLMDHLEILKEDVVEVIGRDPFEPPYTPIGHNKNKNSLGGLIEEYIRYRTATSPYDYSKKIAKRLHKSQTTVHGWIKRSEEVPLFGLKIIVDDLRIPLEEIIQAYGKNPFTPPLEEIKARENPLGSLIEWYIEFRTGLNRQSYLKKQEGRIIDNFNTVTNWLMGRGHIPLYYLKAISDDLDIPREDLIAIFGRDPFVPPLENITRLENPLGKLIEWYIDFRTRKKTSVYLKELEEGIGRSSITMEAWIKGRERMPLYGLKYLSERLQIPYEELTVVFGRDPFVPPLVEIQKEKFPLGALIDWHIQLKTPNSRNHYLKQQIGKGIENLDTATHWFSGKKRFPSKNLKKIVDDLQIPYNEVNQFLDYDISDPLEVAVRTRNATPEQIVQSAFESLQIPTDSKSLYRLATSFGESADVGISELVDLFYLANPAQMDALMRMKITGQYVKDFLKQHLSSDSGESSGGGNRDLPPFLTITRVIPYESYQKEAALRSHLVDMALRMHMNLPYEIAMERIDAQLRLQPDDKVLQHVLSETKDYLTKIKDMPTRMLTVGK